MTGAEGIVKRVKRRASISSIAFARTTPPYRLQNAENHDYAPYHESIFHYLMRLTGIEMNEIQAIGCIA